MPPPKKRQRTVANLEATIRQQETALVELKANAQRRNNAFKKQEEMLNAMLAFQRTQIQSLVTGRAIDIRKLRAHPETVCLIQNSAVAIEDLLVKQPSLASKLSRSMRALIVRVAMAKVAGGLVDALMMYLRKYEGPRFLIHGAVLTSVVQALQRTCSRFTWRKKNATRGGFNALDITGSVGARSSRP